MALYIGNPTNIIVAQAYQISFLEYVRWMGLPTAVAGRFSIAGCHLENGMSMPDRFL